MHWVEGSALGTQVRIGGWDADDERVDAALKAGIERLGELERALSLALRDSELSQLNANGSLQQPSQDLRRVLACADQVWRRTGGAFDVTVQPLWEVFWQAHQLGHLPSRDLVAEAQARVGWHKVSVTLWGIRLLDGVRLTLNGLAQGYVADEVLAAMQRCGLSHGLVDAGEWAAMGEHPDGRPWRVGIQHPRLMGELLGTVELRGGGLATSGDYRTSFTPDHAAHHVFDPRTGWSPAAWSSVSVLSPSAMLADALSTALMVLNEEKGREAVESWHGVEALWVRKSGEMLRTPGFSLGQTHSVKVIEHEHHFDKARP
jgi:FAD:protein FMN transferase